jgi:mRNA-degrading endonuclease RelE of RelBE toxin-antitoxin system
MEFKEVPGFTSLITDLLSDEEYQGLQKELIENPEKGDLIKATGGARKVRYGIQGRGKRGGIRVIYYYPVANTIHMIAVYPKNKQENLTPEQEQKVAAIVSAIKEGWL